MRVTLEKLDGVQKATVSLKDGKASIVLKPGNSLGLDDLRRAVTRNGFTPKDAAITALADLVTAPAPRAVIAGTTDGFDIEAASPAAVTAPLKGAVVTGTVTTAKNGRSVLRLTSVKPAS